MPNSSRDHHPALSPEFHHNARMVKPYKKPKSRPALCLLVLCGSALMFFALVLIGCSFAINYDEDLDFDDYKLDAKIQSQFNYNQYWAGVPFFVTGALVLFSGIYQRSRGLTITTVIFCIISITLTLFVVALDSDSFGHWNKLEREKAYWDSKSGYSCGTDNASKTCKCTSSSSSQNISDYECNIVRKLSSLYGAVIASSIMVTLFSITTIVIIIKTLSWKRIVYPTHSYYNSADDYYMDTGRRTPSHIDLPVAKRAADFSESNGRKALPYRNYPF
ncbi:uncharacterized protein LOC114530666 isoform X2 [Dendronephthya gigantea]|uniref:uncharacterized protein LOC114530666 isoform X2 n=1 Tax=Dendronephthya gigantea TaxID=151771 RepID=UPI00106AB822|nr:uncharacterized protein LOC114530666 isoform X2 [Dendronephthya gigantea]